MSHRQAQIESTIKRTLAQVLQRRISDPRIEGMVSITRVQVSPDLKDAYVFVSILPTTSERKTLYGLRHAASHIQSVLAKEVAMRTVPHLDFRLDDSLKKQAEIYSAINEAMKRTGLESEAPSDEEGDDFDLPQEDDTETESGR